MRGKRALAYRNLTAIIVNQGHQDSLLCNASVNFFKYSAFRASQGNKRKNLLAEEA